MLPFVTLVLVALAADLTHGTPKGQLHYPEEKRLKNVKQLTFGGMNAEGYFSRDDKYITFQATGLKHYGTECDQIYQLDLSKDPHDPTNIRKISPGLGSTTCSYFYGNNKDSLFAGNFHKIKMLDQEYNATSYNTCPPKKCKQKYDKTNPLWKLCNTSYTWDIYQDYDIFKVNEYGNIVQQLTKNNYYDAEATFSPDGKTILFTSMRSGDLELYTMNADGSNVKQLTKELGYDGGAFFSRDGTKIVWRASRPKTDAEVKKYKELLKYDLVEPLNMELFVMNADGTNQRQITHLGSANWAPFYLNDSKTIIFSSNHAAGAAGGYEAFTLYTIQDDGTHLERITFGKGDFNSFPMMNYAGTKLIWGSSRMGGLTELDLFIADWITFGKGDFNSFAMMNYDGTKLVWGSSRMGGLTELDLFIADWVYDLPPTTTATTSPAQAVVSTIASFLGL